MFYRCTDCSPLGPLMVLHMSALTLQKCKPSILYMCCLVFSVFSTYFFHFLCPAVFVSLSLFPLSSLLQLFPFSSPLTAGLPCINAVPDTGCQTKSCFVSSLATAMWWGPTVCDIGNRRKRVRCDERQSWWEVYISIWTYLWLQPNAHMHMNITRLCSSAWMCWTYDDRN